MKKNVKRLLTIMMVLVMVLSFAACVDSDAAIDTFNSVNDKLTAASNLANENLDKVDQKDVEKLNTIVEKMGKLKVEIESEDLTQERADAIVEELKPYEEQIKTLTTNLEESIAANK